MFACRVPVRQLTWRRRSGPGGPFVRKVSVFLERLVRDEDGVSIVEYALLLALIAMVVLGLATILGAHISSFFSSAASAI
jgi:pilus assembly protein Flp/PilA